MAINSSLISVISISLLISLFILYDTNLYFNSNEIRPDEKHIFRWQNILPLNSSTTTTITTTEATSPTTTETSPTTKATSLERYVVTFGAGRLGNQMNNLATLYVLEVEYGPKAALIPSQFKLLSTYFYTDEFNHYARNLGHKYPFYWKLPWKDTEPNYTDPDKSKWPAKDCGKYIRIREYPVDVEVYKNYLPQLQEVFKPKQIYVDEAFKRLTTIAEQHTLKHPDASDADLNFVSIHVRRADYLRSLEGNGFPEVDLNYYYNAMKYFRDKYKNVLFYVLSDDAKWVHANLGNITYYIGAEEPWEGHRLPSEQNRIGIDHALLRQANHSIMTYGSFGMWGALLNQGGEIVIPKTHTEYETLKYMLKANLSNIVVI